jgi:prepilin peptidase CpaA
MLVIATRMAIGGLLIIAAAYDIRSFRIPNVIPLLLALLFAGTWAVGAQGALTPHALSFACAGVVSVALFLANVWGGGDTKLTAAMALFLTPTELGRFLLVAALVGGVVAATILIVRRRNAAPTTRNTPLPYGVALAAGGLDWCVLG